MSEFSLPAKPFSGEPCNGCGYCCTASPCQLAIDYLHCSQGPCVALETKDGRTHCGFVRNPLGYLFDTEKRQSEGMAKDAAPDLDAARALSDTIAQVLGIGRGCDAEDDEDARAWPQNRG